MKITIFGSSGFVGKNLLQILSKKNFELISADLAPIKLDGINHHIIDIKQKNDVFNVVSDSDVLIHLAAHPLVKSFSEIQLNMEINLMGIINILEAAKTYNIKKIIFSSASSLIGEPTENPVPENHFPLPKTPYGVAKLASEHLIRIYKENYGIDYTIFRFFNIYGPYQTPPALIPNIFSKISSNEPIDVFGDGSQVRDYVYVPDIVEFIIDSIDNNQSNNKLFNMGSGKGHTVMDVINITSKILNKQPKIRYNDFRPGEISNFVADPTLLKAIFGKIPQTSLEDGIQKTFEWYSNNR